MQTRRRRPPEPVHCSQRAESKQSPHGRCEVWPCLIDLESKTTWWHHSGTRGQSCARLLAAKLPGHPAPVWRARLRLRYIASFRALRLVRQRPPPTTCTSTPVGQCTCGAPISAPVAQSFLPCATPCPRPPPPTYPHCPPRPNSFAPPWRCTAPWHSRQRPRRESPPPLRSPNPPRARPSKRKSCIHPLCAQCGSPHRWAISTPS
ncbi:MAG: hypothetical protein KatS3mg077_3359 [Candidatus Binatia bacterium]|nr:MAG: hypothetical protein KatS3mg077_3359 [Candidatus Binatia bacterium]